METGSSSEFDEGVTLRNGKRHNPVPAATVEPFVPKSDHNPRELRSWAKRTGFVSDYSGEAGTSASKKFDGVGLNLERNREQKNGGSSPKIEIDPILGRTRRDRGNEIQPENGPTREATTRTDNERALNLGIENQKKHDFRGNANVNANGVVNRESNGHGTSTVAPVPEVKNEEEDMAEGDVKVNMYPEGEGPDEGGRWQRPPGLTCGLRENPGFG